MGGVNSFGVALKIIETGKYKDNKVVCAIIDTLKLALNTLDIHAADAMAARGFTALAPLAGFIKGARGEDGYSTWLSANDVTREMHNSIQIALSIKEVQAKCECLIFVLNALGEEIEY